MGTPPASTTRSDWSPSSVWAGLRKPVFIPASLVIFGLIAFFL